MIKLLDLGMSDPLTLGMASPLADRIEILARKRPVTKLSRSIAGSVLLGVTALSAPLTIAGEHPHEESETKSVIMFSDGALWSSDGEKKLRSGGAYEIVTEDGDLKAYQIRDGGDTRQEISVNLTDAGVYELTLQNGEVVTFEKPDLSGLEGLKGLEGLQGLEALKGLEGLKGLRGLEGLSGLSKLESLSALSELGDLGDMDFPQMLEDGDVKIILKGNAQAWFENEDGMTESIREKIQSAAKNGDIAGQMRFFTRDGAKNVYRFSDEQGFEFPGFDGESLPDTVIHFGDKGIRVERSLDIAKRQLVIAEQQLEQMADDGETSRELKQALRDLEKAKKSLEKARLKMEAED